MCRLAGRQALLVGFEAREVCVPAVRQSPALHLVDLGGDLGIPVGDPLLPLGAQSFSTLADAPGEMLVDAIRDQELRVLGPAVGALGLANLVLAERLAMRLGRVLLVRRAVADVAVDDDQRWPVALLLELLEG